MLPRKLSSIFCAPVFCVLAFALPCASFGQEPASGAPPAGHQGPPPGGPPTAAQELTRLDHALTLTDAQKTAILPILEKRRTDMEALRQGGGDPGASRDGVRTLMETSRTQIRALLTESQQQSFDTMRPPRRPHGGDEGPGGQGPPPPDGAGTPPQG